MQGACYGVKYGTCSRGLENPGRRYERLSPAPSVRPRKSWNMSQFKTPSNLFSVKESYRANAINHCYLLDAAEHNGLWDTSTVPYQGRFFHT